MKEKGSAKLGALRVPAVRARLAKVGNPMKGLLAARPDDAHAVVLLGDLVARRSPASTRAPKPRT